MFSKYEVFCSMQNSYVRSFHHAFKLFFLTVSYIAKF